MYMSLAFIRILFVFLCVLFLTTYATQILPGGFNTANIIIGISSGALLGVAFIGIDLFLKRYNLRSFNIAVLGLFLGYLLGQATMLIFNAIGSSLLPPEASFIFTSMIYLFTAYLGMVMTLRASEEIHLSIPFVKLKTSTQKKKDLIIDPSILMDSRIIDLATSGLLDDHLVMPRFALKDLLNQADNGDETAKSRARRCLEVFKKLETTPFLDMRFSDTDFPENKDLTAKLIQLARLLDSNIITADISKIQQSAIEGIRIINIHSLSNALKPLTHAGEFLNIKVQRYGKEPRQGVGYLDDGTMVVINGGAEFIGETIRSQVLSVKHTSSGRMIFCNATEEMGMTTNTTDEDLAGQAIRMESAHKNYFAL